MQEGSEGLQERSEGQLEGSERSEGQLEGSEGKEGQLEGLERFISYDSTVNFYFDKKNPKKSLFWGVLRLLTVGAHPRPFQTDMKDEFHSSTRSNAL